jgi:endonuclease/exonuclease/phosphatase family metal-dependent hydrolase
MVYVFGIEFEELAQGRSGRPAFHGQALLSRFPVIRTRVLRFRHQSYNWGPRWKPRWAWLQPRRGGRMALIVELEWGGRPCVIYNTHLESKDDDAGRAKQVREILDDIQAHYASDIPVIVAGDLNTRKGADSPVLEALKAGGFQDALQDSKGRLRTKVGSNKRADWILVRGLHFSEARILELVISDHYPLMVRLARPPAAESGSSQYGAPAQRR